MISRSAQIGGQIRTAYFSECEMYRYQLDIVWDLRLDRIAICALNPSKADHIQDDNTMTRITGFAKAWGYGGFSMFNAFAYRSTNPAELFKVPDPIGPENTIEFLARSMGTTRAFAAWGTNIQKKPWKHYYRGHDITLAVPHLECFRYTASGHPEHPLYLPKTIIPSAFCYPGAA